MQKALPNVIATDSMFNLQSEDIQFLENVGVNNLVLVTQSEVETSIFRSLKR